jgi:hypothetical protein
MRGLAGNPFPGETILGAGLLNAAAEIFPGAAGLLPLGELRDDVDLLNGPKGWLTLGGGADGYSGGVRNGGVDMLSPLVIGRGKFIDGGASMGVLGRDLSRREEALDGDDTCRVSIPGDTFRREKGALGGARGDALRALR